LLLLLLGGCLCPLLLLLLGRCTLLCAHSFCLLLL
jgi:hypothetical protein